MKSSFTVIALLWFLVQPCAEAGGGLVGNGGDTVFCRKDQSNNFDGYYSLDYLLTYQRFNNNSDIVPVTTWAASQKRISRILQTDSDLSYSFNDFSRRMLSHTDVRSRIWKEAAFGLIDLRDEQIIRQLPVNCRQEKPGNEGAINIIQTVIRQQRPDLIVYEYDPQIIRDLALRTPLQYSFLMIHEWLWDYTDDVRVLRDVNRYLHSKAAENSNPIDVKAVLLRLGLDLSSKNFKPICDRPKPIREAIERLYKRLCTYIDQEFLAQSALSGGAHTSLTIKLDRPDLVSISHTDFAHLTRVDTLEITNSDLEFISQRAIASLNVVNSLYWIVLSGNKLTHLDAQFVASLNNEMSKNKEMVKLDFSNNLIRELPEEICNIIVSNSDRTDSKTHYADFRNNPLSEQAKDILKKCQSAGKRVYF